LDLAEFVLQNVAARALQHAERAALKPCRVLLGLDEFGVGAREGNILKFF
jgi:hypothetical protein